MLSDFFKCLLKSVALKSGLHQLLHNAQDPVDLGFSAFRSANRWNSILVLYRSPKRMSQSSSPMVEGPAFRQSVNLNRNLMWIALGGSLVQLWSGGQLISDMAVFHGSRPMNPYVSHSSLTRWDMVIQTADRRPLSSNLLINGTTRGQVRL